MIKYYKAVCQSLLTVGRQRLLNYRITNALQSNINTKCNLVQQSKFQRSTLKQIFSNQNSQKQYNFFQNIGKLVNNFPYCKLPKITREFPEQKKKQQNYEKFVAFSCLFMLKQTTRQEQLKKFAQLLLKEDIKHLQNEIKNNNLNGQLIFTEFYKKKVPQIVKKLNMGSLEEQTKIFYLQILTNLIPQESIRQQIQKIEQQKLLDENTHILSLYAKLLVKHDLSYIKCMDKIFLKFNQQSNNSLNQKTLNQIQLNTAKVLISIHNYNELLPQKLKLFCINAFIESIQNLSPIQHITIIKFIYMDRSKECFNYIQKLTQTLISYFKQGKGQKLHVPLTMKIIKYRSKLHLQNKMFGQIVEAFPEKFNSVFKQKMTNKQIFLTLLNKEMKTTMNEQIKGQFASYIHRAFNDYEKMDEINENNVLRDIKLLLKYGNNFKKSELNRAVDILINNIYQRAKESVSEQFKYYLFLIYHVFNLEKDFGQCANYRQILKQVPRIYNQKALLNNATSQQITRAINIQYQLCRKNIQTSRINIFKYNYQNIQLSSRVYSYVFYLLKKQSQQKCSRKDKLKVLDSLKKHIYKQLYSGKFANKVLYTLIDCLTQLKFEDKYMYIDIERALGNELKKALTDSQLIPLPKDLNFLKQRLSGSQPYKCSRRFAQFLRESISNYDLIKQYIKGYVEKAQNWQNMRKNEKRNRLKQGQNNLNKKQF